MQGAATAPAVAVAAEEKDDGGDVEMEEAALPAAWSTTLQRLDHKFLDAINKLHTDGVPPKRILERMVGRNWAPVDP
jgi:hypothetical protein